MGGSRWVWSDEREIQIPFSEEIAHLEQQLSALDPRFGDRLNEITVIGTQRHREYFVGQLQTCFCTEAEIQHWQQGGRFQDPWPQALKARG